MTRPTQATINLQALRHNTAHARTLAGTARLLAVVKANAYGHGASQVAVAIAEQVDAFGVACLEEALQLRAAGITRPILLMEGVFEAQELDNAAREQLWPAITNEQQLAWLEQAQLSAPLQVWLKVNTGMNRLGIAPAQVTAFLQRIYDCPQVIDHSVAPVVVFTHLSSADNLHSDATLQQLKQFAELPLAGAAVARSAANSGGLLQWPASHYDWVRPGYMLYGNSPLDAAHSNTAALKPVMTLTSRIIALRNIEAGEAVGYGGTFVAQRPTTIACVAIGYGDGYPRQAVNGTPVLVNGQRAALAGRVSMDMLMIDVTGIANVALGTPVVLWGDGLPVDEVARYAGTVGYELLTRLPARPPRVVVED